MKLGALPLVEGGGAKHSPPGEHIEKHNIITYKQHTPATTDLNIKNHDFSKFIKTHPNTSEIIPMHL